MKRKYFDINTNNILDKYDFRTAGRKFIKIYKSYRSNENKRDISHITSV